MYQTALRTADFPSRRTETVDLGFTPPLDAGTRRHALDERRRVSTRWLSATVLTGVFGGGLMGLAVVAALDTQSDFAEQPEYVVQQPARPISDSAVTTARKGDKLVRKVDLLSAKQTFRTPTTTRSGDKEVIKVKAFSRVAGPLLLASTDFRDEVPAFNAMKIMADGATERSIETASPAPDDNSADVSLVTSDLAAAASLPLHNASLGEDEARRQANDVFNQPRSRSVPTLMISPQSMLARSMKRTTEAPLGYADLPTQPFSSLEVRMVPENVTVVPRLETPPAAMLPEEKIVTAKRGETAEAVLRATGATPAEARAAAAALLGKDGEIGEGKRLKLLFAPLSASDPAKSLVRVMLYKDEALEAITAVNDAGVFVSVAPQTEAATPASHNDDDEENGDEGGMRLFNSLYETGLKNDVPKSVIESLIRIFSYDVDFQRTVNGGDAFDVLYAEDDDAGGIQKGDILYASIQVGGETKYYYRFMTPDDNNVDYYDENGRSARKFLMRKPVVDAVMRSGFGFRFHPILGYGKMHTGVDWAAKVGTPILAAGNGVVIKADWDSGYGRRTEIQHINGYVTTYNHQSAFAKGIVPGAKVRQGQVIGYIGATGLATGPHLHYEVIVNDHFVDPMRIKLPRGRELDGKMLADFKREHDRIDDLLKKSPTQTHIAQQ